MCPGILMIPETHEIVRRLVFRARKIFCNCIKRIGREECFAFAEYAVICCPAADFDGAPYRVRE